MPSQKKETMVYEKLGDNKVKCGVCPRRCVIEEGERGFCNVRENQDGTLYSLVYGKAVSSTIDPIEKKPLFHFAPGSRALSVATVGCNMKCDFCQNFRISQTWSKIRGNKLMPEDLVRQAFNYDCSGIAYTYTEPTVFLEYAFDSMMKAETQLYNVFVSNGYMTQEVITEIAPHLDAINVDIKGNRDFYRKHCQVPHPQPIYDALKEFKEHNVWIEVTNLIVPDENDEEKDIRKMVNWVKDNLGKETPLHFSKFHPHHELTEKPSTPLSTLEEAMDIAREEGMHYVYCGNVPGHKSESTFCPTCGQRVIKRRGFSIEEFKLGKNLRCPNCGTKIDIAGESWIPDKLFKS